MRRLFGIAVVALLLAGALLVTAPATLVDARVGALSNGRVRVANATGTIWNGSGELVLLPAAARQPLAWHLDTWPLLAGRVQGRLATGPEGLPGATFSYARDHVELHALSLSLPLASLLPFFTAAKLSLGGMLVVEIDHLVWLGSTLDAQLSVQWRDASAPGPRAEAPLALGDVRFDLNGRGSELTGPVKNSGGEVEISGQMGVAATGATHLDLTLRPRAGERERADFLAATLAALGPPDAEGGYRVRWSGAWR